MTKKDQIPWASNIPDGWKIEKIGRALKYVKVVAGDKHVLYPRLSLTNSGVIERSKYDGNGQSPADYNTYQIVPENQFVFNLMGLEQDSDYRRVGVPDKAGLLSSGYVRMDKYSDILNTKFGYWYFLMMEGQRIFNIYGTGIRSTLNGKQLERLPLILPPMDEQLRISEFLDAKVRDIDALINATQESIEILVDYKRRFIQEITLGKNMSNLVDSYVDWIGKVPASWTIRPLKSVFSQIGSGTTPDSGVDEFYEGGTEYWIQSGDLYKTHYVTDTKKKITSVAIERKSALKEYRAPFLAIAMYGASIGNVAISKIDASVNQAVAVLGDSIGISDYYYYVLESAKEELTLSATGGTQPNISQDKLKRLKVPFPPIETQREIARQLDEFVQQVDGLVLYKETMIDNLNEYKRSLIYEVVTGKKRV